MWFLWILPSSKEVGDCRFWLLGLTFQSIGSQAVAHPTCDQNSPFRLVGLFGWLLGFGVPERSQNGSKIVEHLSKIDPKTVSVLPSFLPSFLHSSFLPAPIEFVKVGDGSNPHQNNKAISTSPLYLLSCAFHSSSSFQPFCDVFLSFSNSFFLSEAQVATIVNTSKNNLDSMAPTKKRTS